MFARSVVADPQCLFSRRPAACVHVMELPQSVHRGHTQPMLSHVNVGTRVDCTIRELAETIARITGFGGRLVFDISKPVGSHASCWMCRNLRLWAGRQALGWNLG